MLKRKHPPMILPSDLKSKEKVLRAVNEAVTEIWVELARLDRRLKRLKSKIEEENEESEGDTRPSAFRAQVFHPKKGKGMDSANIGARKNKSSRLAEMKRGEAEEEVSGGHDENGSVVSLSNRLGTSKAEAEQLSIASSNMSSVRSRGKTG